MLSLCRGKKSQCKKLFVSRPLIGKLMHGSEEKAKRKGHTIDKERRGIAEKKDRSRVSVWSQGSEG